MSSVDISLEKLLDCLDIKQSTVGGHWVCQSKRKTNCWNAFSGADKNAITSNLYRLIEFLAQYDSHRDEIECILKALSVLLLCRKNHRNESSCLLLEWKPRLQSIIKTREPRREDNSARHSNATTTKLEPRSRDIQTPVCATTELVTDCQLKPAAHSLQGSASGSNPTLHSSDFHAYENTLKNIPSVAISSTRHLEFSPLLAKNFPEQASSDIIKKIKLQPSTYEKELGYIVGFRGEVGDLIRLGHCTNSVKQYLEDIEKKCKYSPVLVFKLHTIHAKRILHLVKMHLYEQRRREHVCNGGYGCRVSHDHWFEGVSDSVTQAVAEDWIRWASYPSLYDANGTLTDEWARKAENLKPEGNEGFVAMWQRFTQREAQLRRDFAPHPDVAMELIDVVDKLRKMTMDMQGQNYTEEGFTEHSVAYFTNIGLGEVKEQLFN